MIFKLKYLLIFMSLLCLQNSFASTMTSKNKCHPYFAQNDVLSSLTQTEKNSLDKTAQMLSTLLGQQDAQSVQTKANINASIQNFVIKKRWTLEEKNLFKAWLSERIRFHMHVEKILTDKAAVASQRHTETLQTQKEAFRFEMQKIKEFLKKYEERKVVTGPVTLSTVLSYAYYSKPEDNPTRQEDLLFILDRFESLEISNSLFLVVVCNDHLPAIKHFVEHGAELGVHEDIGKPPLHIAAKYNPNPEVIQFLIQADGGAQLNTKDTKEWGDTPLHNAALNPNPEILKTLLEAGADPTLKNDEGNEIPLHYAIVHNPNIDLILGLLLKVKPQVQINAKDVGGRTPLHLAIESKEIKIIKLLIDAGADPTLKNNEEMTALGYASSRQDLPLEIFQFLIAWDQGAQLMVPTTQGFLPLHTAVNYIKDPKIIELFLQTHPEAQINAKTIKGNTPLHLAIYNSVEILKTLLEAGADPTLQNTDKTTALSMVEALVAEHPFTGATLEEYKQKQELLRRATAQWNREHPP